MEEVLAIIFLFGGGAATLIAYSPIGKAFAARIRGETPQSLAALQGTDPAVLEELDRLRQELAEVQERLDFTERMLANRSEPAALKEPEA
ncbi:MAG: hypothetical protein SFV24_21710 [Gemmatimonadales bacterium]|nr:hypothetical protein [Gemmatimonadales bacterium]MDX2060442.1 hypothetical protein [Gemmatimonadales bacterium]